MVVVGGGGGGGCRVQARRDFFQFKIKITALPLPMKNAC